MSISEILNTSGLVLNVIGSGLLLKGPAIRWFQSLFNKQIKSEIEDEAITATYAVLAPNTKEEQLANRISRNVITNYKISFFSFIFLFVGFTLQLVSSFL